MSTSYSCGDSDWTQEEKFSQRGPSAIGIISQGPWIPHWTSFKIQLLRVLGHLV